MRAVKIAFVSLISVLLYVNVVLALGVMVSPGSLSVPSNTSSVRTLTYEVTNTTGCDPGGPGVTSTGGVFITNTGIVLGSITSHVTLTNGIANESLTIPYNVIVNAENHNVSSFLYKRSFTCTAFSTVPPNIKTTVTINIQHTPGGLLKITPSPSAFSVAYNRSFVENIRYSFVRSACVNHPSSSYGEFVTNSGYVLGRVNKVVTETNNTAYETVNIPLSVMKNAVSKRVSSFIYKRTFVCNNYQGAQVTSDAKIRVNLLSKASMPLTITRVRLYFKNNRAEITVKKNEPLTAYADINFMGSGVLKGYWEVDGRVLSPMVFKNLTYGKKITLKTPSVPPLPTFSYGTHFVKFVIMQPKPIFDMPKIIYFVEANLNPVKKLTLVSPKNNAFIKLSEDTPLQFVWKPGVEDSFYIIQFFSYKDKKPLFSAYTVNSSYVMPPYVIKHYFKKGIKYRWMVEGFGKKSNVTRKSVYYHFIMK